jgi:type I restriction enzyme S subunit
VRRIDLLATAPHSVAKLRELILSLAVRGKLVDQRPGDEPASVLTRRFKEEKAKLIAAGEIKREKSRSTITDDELPYELPQGWQWIRLGELLTKIGAGSTPRGGREVYTSTGVKFLRSQNVWNNGLSLNGVAHIPKAVHERMSGTKVVAGDLLFNITGASIGRCALVPDDFDEANVSQHVTIIRVVLAQIRQFLHLVLISPHVQQTVMDVQVGVSREGLSIGKLGQFVVPLPPLAEQARIVARVEELMQLCDALEAHGRLQDEQHARLVATLFDALAASESADALAENWKRIATHFDLLLDRPEAVDTLEQTLLQLAVRGLLVPRDPSDEPARELLARIQKRADRIGTTEKRREQLQPLDAIDAPLVEAPSGWLWVTFDRTWESSFYGPRFAAGDYVERGGIPTVRTTDMSGGRIVLKDAPCVSVPESKRKLYLVRKGDLLVTRSGSIGVMALFDLDVDAIPSAYLIRLRFNEVVTPTFAHLFLTSPTGRDLLGLSTTSVGVPNVSASKMARFPMLLPPLAEQHRIVTRVEQLRRLCANLRERLQQSRTTQSHLADALVSAAAQSPAC